MTNTRTLAPSHHVDRENSTPMSNFWSLVEPIVRKAAPRSVVEIGSAEGHTSRMLAALGAEIGFELNVVDPILKPGAIDGARVHSMKSVDFMPTAPASGVWVIDGDHNHATVTAELEGAWERRERGRPFVALLHDVGFPWGRRDMWHDPSEAPAEVLRGEPSLDHDGVETHANLGGGTIVAPSPGGARNGVLTAVEDFMAAHPGRFGYVQVDAFFGLGILWDLEAAGAELGAEIDGIAVANARMRDLLRCLEANRLRLLQSHFLQADSAAANMVAKRNPVRWLAGKLLSRLAG